MAAQPRGRHSGARAVGWIGYGLASAVLSLVLLELGTRLIFVPKVGARILLYGFGADRDVRDEAIPLPFRWDEKVALEDESKRLHGTGAGRYSKYQPRQKLLLPVRGEDYYPRINESGFRGAEFAIAKPPGVVRVIALGASSTFGYHDRDDETYPHYLAQELAKQGEAKGRSGVRYEVFNFGIPHLDSDAIRALFETEALDFDPDVVTFYEGMNDTRRIAREADERLLIDVGRYSLFVRFVQYLLTEQLESFSSEDVAHHSAGRGAQFVSNVQAIADQCKQRGIEFVVVSQQATSKMVPASDIDRVSFAQEVALVRSFVDSGDRLGLFGLQLLVYSDIDRHLRDWIRESGTPFVDAIAMFDEARMRHTLVSWVHLSPEGNRFLARALAAEILALLDARGPDAGG